MQYNRTILDREIVIQQNLSDREEDSAEAEDIFLLLDELWGNRADMEAFQKAVHTVSDLYKHIPMVLCQLRTRSPRPENSTSWNYHCMK
jgi:hypothetical protein